MAIGGPVALIDPLRRRLGDLAADTIVVRDVRVALPTAMLEQRTRVNTFAADPAIAEESCSAMVDLASRGGKGIDKEQKQKALQAVVAKSHNDSTKKKAEEMLSGLK